MPASRLCGHDAWRRILACGRLRPDGAFVLLEPSRLRRTASSRRRSYGITGSVRRVTQPGGMLRRLGHLVSKFFATNAPTKQPVEGTDDRTIRLQSDSNAHDRPWRVAVEQGFFAAEGSERRIPRRQSERRRRPRARISRNAGRSRNCKKARSKFIRCANGARSSACSRLAAARSSGSIRRCAPAH